MIRLAREYEEVCSAMVTNDDDQFSVSVASAAGDFSRARATLEGAAAFDSALWERLTAVGAWGLLIPPSAGGPGAELSDQVTVSRVLSRVSAPVPATAVALASVVLSRSALPEARRMCDELMRGARVIGACLASYGTTPLQLDATGSRLDGVLEFAADATSLETLIVEAGGHWWAVEVSDPGLDVVALGTLDPTRPVATVEFTNVEGIKLARSDDLDQVYALWWLLLAAEATGAAEAALGMAVDYARLREQFGQPIGAFQAIQHKLVEDLIALEGARSALVLAISSASASGAPRALEARVAKVVAGESGAKILTDSIQVQGAMANTWEHDAHLLLRRVKSAQATAGSVGHHREALRPLIASSRPGESTGDPDVDAIMTLSEDDLGFLEELQNWLDRNATSERINGLYVRGDRQIAARREWQRFMADASWAGIHWPREFGGRDATLGQQMLYHHELASRGLPPLIGNRGLSLIGPTIIAHGSADQCSKFVEATRTGDLLWASGLSEREAGSDLAGLQTRGVVDGDDLVIDGHKIWTTAAQYADWIFCLVRTNSQAAKHEGITCVLVPLASKGIEVMPIRRITGEPEFNEVFFDGVRIPLANIVGDIDAGWGVARTTLSYEHMTNFLGTQMRLAGTVDRIGRRLSSSVSVDASLISRHTDAWIDTQLLRIHGLRNVSRLEQGSKPGPEGSILKLFGQELEKRLFELGLDAGGDAAVVNDKWARGFLGTRASTVGGGTSEVHRNKLAERVLDLPRMRGFEPNQVVSGASSK